MSGQERIIAISILVAAVFVAVLPSDAIAQSRPNLVAEWRPFITVMTPIPYRPQPYCTLTLVVKNTGRDSFNRSFKVEFRPKVDREPAFWQYGNVWSPFQGRVDECQTRTEGVDCWLAPIPPGGATSLEIGVFPMEGGTTILDVRVDTRGNVTESHEANTFITATVVKVPRSGERTPCG